MTEELEEVSLATKIAKGSQMQVSDQESCKVGLGTKDLLGEVRDVSKCV